LRRALVTVLALCALLCGCGGGGSGGSAPPPPMIGRVETLSIASVKTAFTYPIQVYLPPAYDANATARLPVIYAVDGDAFFGYSTASISNAPRFEALKEVLQHRGTAAILVGIGGTSRRNTDFLEPGAVPYHDFITQELVPRIDAQYRTSTRRILSGLSYGGTFTFLAFTFEAPLGAAATFKDFWSIETAQPNGNGFVLLSDEQAVAASVQGKSIPLTLFFVGATQGNGPYVQSIYNQMTTHSYPNLNLQFEMLSTMHVAADVPAFGDALTRFFPCCIAP
jgi:hypothetical protein